MEEDWLEGQSRTLGGEGPGLIRCCSLLTLRDLGGFVTAAIGNPCTPLAVFENFP